MANEATRIFIERLKRDIENGRLAFRSEAFDDLIKYGYYESARELLSFAINIGYFDDMKVLLKNAIQFDNIPMVKIILDLGLDPNFRYPILGDRTSKSPLDIAIQYGNPAMVDTILEFGTELPQGELTDPNDQDDNGDTSLLIALQRPSLHTKSIVQILMHHGANPYIKNNNDYDAYTMLLKQKDFFSDDIYQEILDLLDSYQEPDKYY